MHISLLDYFLISQISAFFFIFCRVGAAILSLPGFGESYVSTRVRLILALCLSLVLTPVLAAKMPLLPASPLLMFTLMTGEILIGLMIGVVTRLLLMVLHTAGNVIATQSSLAVAAAFDPTSANQSAILGNILGVMALAMLFALNLHHLMLAAIAQSYDVFAPGNFPSTGDMNTLVARMVGDCFRLGVMLAGPHIAYSLLFYFAGGLMSRLMPNFQIFYVMTSLQILMAVFLLLAILPMMFTLFTNFAQEQLTHLTGASL